MFKYLIPLLILISPPLTLAGDILNSGLSIGQSVKNNEPLGVVYATNDWRNGKYIVRIKITEGDWEYINRYIFTSDPSDQHIYVHATNRVSKVVEILPVRVPFVKYPKSYYRPIETKVSISQEFGKTKYNSNHSGIDFAINNAKVFSIYSGKVVYAGWDKFSSLCHNGGNMIKIQHNNGLYSVYMHLKKILIRQGSSVKEGDIIAISGNTGKQDCKPLGNHLHFEIRTSANQRDVINPRYILNI